MPSGFTVRHYHRVRYCIRIHILYSSLVQSLWVFNIQRKTMFWSAPVPGLRCPASGWPGLHPHLDRSARATGSLLAQRRLQALSRLPGRQSKPFHNLLNWKKYSITKCIQFSNCTKHEFSKMTLVTVTSIKHSILFTATSMTSSGK